MKTAEINELNKTELGMVTETVAGLQATLATMTAQQMKLYQEHQALRERLEVVLRDLPANPSLVSEQIDLTPKIAATLTAFKSMRVAVSNQRRELKFMTERLRLLETRVRAHARTLLVENGQL